MLQNSIIKYDEDALEDFRKYLSEANFSKVFFLVDENTHEHCLIPLLQQLPELPDTEVLEIEAGEDSKSPEVLHQLWMALSELEADRYSLLVNVGGGVIGDLGGFLAGTYMRGIAFVNFPTTILAQVDASVGGKTGINLQGLKNHLGLFLKPERVYIIHDFLQTLPLRERRSGYAEMLKHGLIADRGYWRQLLALNIATDLPNDKMIKRSVEIKSAIVEEDFKESGLRKVLNFGHTIGHALETSAMESGNPLMHGEAVALGMMAELMLSVDHGGLDRDDAEEAIQALKERYRDVQPTGSTDRLLELVKADKKNRSNQMRFVLLESIGKAKTDVIIEESKIVEVLTYLNTL